VSPAPRRPGRARRRAGPPAVLTIAGSDSGGGAGIQADLKTFEAFGVFGTAAITCLTAQNPGSVSAIHPAPAGMVAEQVRQVCRGFPIAAAKTGMLYSAALIRAVAAVVRECRLALLVVDPVMVATSGARLLRPDAVLALCQELLPLAAVITPNVPEAEVLTGLSIRTRAEARAAARLLAIRYGTACVVKGGHLPGARLVDVLCDGTTVREFAAPRLRVRQTHGTGCTFSAALTAGLALGHPLPDAVRGAQQFVRGALRGARAVGPHFPLNFAWQG
jgi:hydroxymethylpyrimidine/phosphomethylpyrimidine kinase